MTKNQRVFLIHGWTGHTNKDWFPWAKEELIRRGYETILPEMPDSDNPSKKKWLEVLHTLIDTPKDDDVLIGHSLGGLAVLRYIETLHSYEKVGKVILVAPMIVIGNTVVENLQDQQIVDDWLGEPLNYEKILSRVQSFSVILSKSDHLIPFDANRRVLEKNLKLKVLSIENCGHFTQEDGIVKLPQLFKTL